MALCLNAVCYCIIPPDADRVCVHMSVCTCVKFTHELKGKAEASPDHLHYYPSPAGSKPSHRVLDAELLSVEKENQRLEEEILRLRLARERHRGEEGRRALLLKLPHQGQHRHQRFFCAVGATASGQCGCTRMIGACA